MRQGQQNKRMRGRSRKGPNPLTRSFESNGGDVKIRGTALHIAEKYGQLARDAQSSGDRVAAENYLQHAEHYYRIVAAAQAQLPQPQPITRSDDDSDDDDDQDSRGNGSGGDHRPGRQSGQPAFGPSDPQPYINGDGSDQAGNDAGDAAALPESGGGRDRGGQGGGFRRRRAYRDRQGGDRSEQGRVDAGAEVPQGKD